MIMCLNNWFNFFSAIIPRVKWIIVEYLIYIGVVIYSGVLKCENTAMQIVYFVVPIFEIITLVLILLYLK